MVDGRLTSASGYLVSFVPKCDVQAKTLNKSLCSTDQNAKSQNGLVVLRCCHAGNQKTECDNTAAKLDVRQDVAKADIAGKHKNDIPDILKKLVPLIARRAWNSHTKHSGTVVVTLCRDVQVF